MISRTSKNAASRSKQVVVSVNSTDPISFKFTIIDSRLRLFGNRNHKIQVMTFEWFVH